jgi:hypothetical protein
MLGLELSAVVPFSVPSVEKGESEARFTKLVVVPSGLLKRIESSASGFSILELHSNF